MRPVRDGGAARFRLRRGTRLRAAGTGRGAAGVMADPTSIAGGGVASPRGFRAAGISAGIKANNGLDLALIVSDLPARAAAVFTTNLAIAAPVVVSREHLAR